MKVTILDDYFDTLRTLECFAKLAALKNEQCVYTTAEASIVMGLCTNKGQTWSTTR